MSSSSTSDVMIALICQPANNVGAKVPSIFGRTSKKAEVTFRCIFWVHFMQIHLIFVETFRFGHLPGQHLFQESQRELCYKLNYTGLLGCTNGFSHKSKNEKKATSVKGKL